MDVIEHFKKQKLGTVVDSYYNLLNSDGFAIIGTPNIASRPYASQRRLDTHEFEFTRDEFEKTLLKKFKKQSKASSSTSSTDPGDLLATRIASAPPRPPQYSVGPQCPTPSGTRRR